MIPLRYISLACLFSTWSALPIRAHEVGCEGGKGADVSSISLFASASVATSVNKPTVVFRIEWGCPDGQGSRWTPQYTTVTHLIVHHSAGTNSSSDWAATVRGIWTFHSLTNNGGRGWGDIGYNYLIDPNGIIYEGRGGGDNVIGAHFSCQNGGTMGVCMLGTFTSVSPTAAALTSLRRLLAWKAEQRGIDPLGTNYHAGTRLILPTISGHRHGNPAVPQYACTRTSCPGDNLYAQLAVIRTNVFHTIHPPALAILRSTHRVVLNWTNAATGFTLQATENPSGTWTNALPAPTAIAGRNWVTNGTSGTAKFYRLRKL